MELNLFKFGFPLRFVGMDMETGGGPMFKAYTTKEAYYFYMPDIFLFGLLFGYLCFNATGIGVPNEPHRIFNLCTIVKEIPEEYEHLLDF